MLVRGHPALPAPRVGRTLAPLQRSCQRWAARRHLVVVPGPRFRSLGP